jgi:hypothetical protein
VSPNILTINKKDPSFKKLEPLYSMYISKHGCNSTKGISVIKVLNATHATQCHNYNFGTRMIL